MYNEKITFTIFTYNEELRIDRVVRNFLPYGKVLVVDNFSTDRTVEIASTLGAEIFLHKNPGWVEDEDTTTKVLNFIKTPWIYWGYADEMVEIHTLAEIHKIIERGHHKIISIPRKNYYYGKSCGTAYAGRLPRIFQKDAIDFKGNKIHHFGRPTVPDQEILHLDIRKHSVHHFISNTTKSQLNTTDRYTDIDSKTAKYEPMAICLLKIAKTFIGNYFGRGAYKAGTAGLFMSIQTSLYQLLLAMKAFEVHHGITKQEIEARNDIIRDRILSDLK